MREFLFKQLSRTYFKTRTGTKATNLLERESDYRIPIDVFLTVIDFFQENTKFLGKSQF